MILKAAYNLAEVSRLIGLPESTVRDMAADGRLATTKIGDRTVVTLTQLMSNGDLWESIQLVAKLQRIQAA